MTATLDAAVIGLEIERAREVLSRASVTIVEERVTRPPWPGEGRGAPRVIAARPCGAGVTLILAHPGYQRTT